MPIARKQNTTFRLSPEARRRLVAMADRKGVSMGVVVEDLVNKAWDDPDGYYVRSAAIQSWMAASFSVLLAQKLLDGTAVEELMTKVDGAAIGLFGPSPEPPEVVARRTGSDPRVQAFLELYRGGLAKA